MEERLKNFKTINLHIDKESYKESKYLAMDSIRGKKKKILQKKEKIKRKHRQTKAIVESCKTFRFTL